MRLPRASVLALALVLAAGCTDVRETQPARTATEQLLFSSAVDRVCAALALRIPDGSRVYVDPSYVDKKTGKYLLATLRDRILRDGGNLVAARAEADLVIEPRVGALSVDRKKTLVGIPAITVPIPLTGDVELPEIALFKRDRQQGVVKLALASYDAKSGALHQSLEPAYGYSQRTEWGVLIFIGWQDNDLIPDPENDPWIGESSTE